MAESDSTGTVGIPERHVDWKHAGLHVPCLSIYPVIIHFSMPVASNGAARVTDCVRPEYQRMDRFHASAADLLQARHSHPGGARLPLRVPADWQ